jgi:hypothetical protein
MQPVIARSGLEFCLSIEHSGGVRLWSLVRQQEDRMAQSISKNLRDGLLTR